MNKNFVEKLKHIDRRWIFLCMLLAVAIPQLVQTRVPEKPTPLVMAVFDKIEDLPDGSLILISFDYSPGGDSELAPMAACFLRHCCLKRHKMLLMTLWPDGPPMVQKGIDTQLKEEFGSLNLKEGVDYLNLGYKPGKEVVIKTIANSFRAEFDDDKRKLDDFPITAEITNLADVDLAITISSGYPGVKEWVQYAATPLNLPLAAGSTAVQAPQSYPYIPNQMLGILAAIKGAAEYEVALGDVYEEMREPKKQDAVRRMAPQLSAHLLIMGLIILGNIIGYLERRQEKQQ